MKRRGFVLVAVGVALTSCGNASTQGSVGSPGTSPSPAGALLVVADPSPYANQTPGVLRFLTLDGKEVAHATLQPDAHVAAVAGARVFVMDAKGKLQAINRNGRVEDLGDLGEAGAPFAADPGGRRWVWSTSTWQGQTITSVVHLGGDGLTAKTIETVTEDNRSLRPYEWTPVGLFVEHGAVGIGGYIPYLAATGPVDELDVSSGRATSIAGSQSCSFSDMSSDGSVACFPSRVQHSVRLIAANGQATDLSLATPRFNLTGDAYFSRDGKWLTVAGAVGAGFQGGEHYGTDLIKASDASISRISLEGVRPAEYSRAACWLADGSLIVYKPDNSADGSGIYLYDPSGTSSLMAKSGVPVGVLTQ